MATKKRKSTKRRTAARRKKAEQRLPAGLGTLFGGLLLIVLAFVQGDSVWRVLHDVLFGLFGCGSFVLGAAVCCLAVLYTRGEELLSRILKLVLGLIFVCGTVIVFSDIQPQGLSALQMLFRLLRQRRQRMALRRRNGLCAGRRAAFAVRSPSGKPYYDRAFVVRQSVHF